jgi:drug/metabolite transporter (DMT)-like permease
MNYFVCRATDSSIDFKVPRNNVKLLVFRSSIMVLHGFIFALSQHILPLPIVHTIGCTGTLFVFLFDFIINSIRINGKQAFGIIAGLIGALIATNGQVLTSLIDPSYEY